MKVAIGADHRGYKLKNYLSNYLKSMGIDVIDLGTNGVDSVDYPDFAISVGEKVSKGEADLGVLICKTGIGMCIAANKVKGVRAAHVCSEKMAKLSRSHNDANVICLPGELLEFEKAKEFLRIFLETPFEGGRHSKRIKKIEEYERS